MNNTTRRSFFGSAWASICSLPLLSAWLARPVEANNWRDIACEASDEVERLRTELRELRRKAAEYDNLMFSSPGHHWQFLNTDLDRVIRWIPVAQLPNGDDGATDGLATDGEIVWQSAIANRDTQERREWIRIYGVTHWCEMPKPPVNPVTEALIHDWHAAITTARKDRNDSILGGHDRAIALKWCRVSWE